MKNVGLIAALSLIVACSGCYASQRDSIDRSYITEVQTLGYQCQRGNLTYDEVQWCRSRYDHVRDQYVNDIARDRELVADGNRRGAVVAIVVVSAVAAGVAAGVAAAANQPNNGQ